MQGAPTVNRTVLNCSSCNAPLTPGALRCDYCGNASPAAAALGWHRPATTAPVYRPLERYQYTRSDRGRVRLGTAFPAIVRCFAKYIGFTGRASLAEFWWWVVFQIAMFWVIAIGNAGINVMTNHTETDVAFKVLLWWWALTFFPGWAVTVRRLHDVRRSGWNTLWLLTYIGALPLLYWVSLPSDSAPNNPWGPPDPI